MAHNACPLPSIAKREYGLIANLKSQLFSKRLNAAKNLYRRDLVCHFGCVNAIEFSSNGELLVSGGDDRRVMLWQFGKAILDHGKPEPMKGLHQSNIFCLGITSDNQRIFSGGNDDIVIVHDVETKGPLEALQHQRAVCGLSIDPFNERVVATAGNDGRLLLFDTRQSVHESLVIARSRKAFHGVMFHPQQVGMLVSANARDGVALWDLRSPKHAAMRYVGNSGTVQNSMSVRFNSTGSLILALRRRMSPVLYDVQSPEPMAEFYHQDYYNSCTMKSCTFAGEGDRYVVSGSDDFNLYMWRAPTGATRDHRNAHECLVESPHIVLYGHRSIVNQVRYNPHYCLIASSGVEKIIKVWSALEYPGMRGDLLEEAQGSDNPREMYSHEDYVSLVHHSGQYISHNYVEQSTNEDPRMMAFFDSLVQRELECLAEETDSLDGSSSAGSVQSNASDSSDTDQIVVDFLPLPPKRTTSNGSRSSRCPMSNRLARLVASRYQKNGRSNKRGILRRSKQSRTSMSNNSTSKSVPGPSGKGKRACRAVRRPAARVSHTVIATHSRVSAPSSERTDSDEPAHCLYRQSGRIIRPLRRRMNLSRAAKRKSKCTYRKGNTRINGSTMIRDIGENNMNNLDSFDDNLALPSTSTGYRGQSSSALFRIAEVDSDDDQSASSRPISPRTQTANQNIPTNLVSIVPTPVNGSRDSLADSLRPEPVETGSTQSENRSSRMTPRRSRRNGRHSLQRSDSSESPSPKDAFERTKTSILERLSPNVGYNRSVARLMNETNESELESSCSTESSMWHLSDAFRTPDSGVGTIAGSSTRNNVPPSGDVSDDPDYQVKFRQRVKRARRNYRNHLDSDSN